MKLATCQICGGRYLPEFEKHVCPPEWKVRLDDDDCLDDVTIYAKDAVVAAETYVEQIDVGCCVQGETVVVVSRHGESWRLIVKCELVPEYTAFDAEDWDDPSTYPLPARTIIPERMKG